MKNVTIGNDPKKAVINTQERLLDALLVRNVEVKMLCQGRGLCATCHVYVTKGAHCLTPMTDREKLTLSILTGAQANSRLACQSHVLGDGVEVELPKGLYIESFSDIESLIGKRTPVPILHPVSGRVLIQENRISRVLIQENRIITRSAINELRDVDIDIKQLAVENAK